MPESMKKGLAEKKRQFAKHAASAEKNFFSLKKITTEPNMDQSISIIQLHQMSKKRESKNKKLL